MAEFHYVISARQIKDDAFTAEPGPVTFLKVPARARDLSPKHIVKGRDARHDWTNDVTGLADGDQNPLSISPVGDILVFVHGYNNTTKIVLKRHRQLIKDLKAEGWKGLVIAFDWPSGNQTLNYLEDRSDAADVALELVKKCISLIKFGQENEFKTNIHLLGHSTGAYVITEAFLQSDRDGKLFKSPWRLGQVALIGGDISSRSLGAGVAWSAPMFHRIMRLTNYSNPYDSVLAVSNAKRLGTSPRVGRVGLPDDPHPKAVNVDCGNYFSGLDPKKSTHFGTWNHSWHIGDRVFARDLAMTMEGAIDRNAIPTRNQSRFGFLELQNAKRPANMANWGIKDAAKDEFRA